MILFKFGALFTILQLCFAAESDVIDWGDSDFKSGVAQHETVLVMFYAPWYVIILLFILQISFAC